jgi:hypothetical protein
LFILFSFCLVYGEENKEDIEQQAISCLEESRQIMQEMLTENFSVGRVNDSLKIAQNFFDSQKVLKEGNRPYDFSLIIPYCEEINKIRDIAFEAQYEIMALNKFYDESINDDMDTTSIDAKLKEIDREMRDERYENIKSLVDKAYQEIINAESSSSTLNVFYKTTTRSLKTFFVENWRYICIVLIVLLTSLFVFRRIILKTIIKRKINSLEIRKVTLKDLIMQTQKDYFQYGKMSEGTYNIRTKKFAELVRDIDRQIPLLREEYLKLDRKIK